MTISGVFFRQTYAHITLSIYFQTVLKKLRIFACGKSVVFERFYGFYK